MELTLKRMLEHAEFTNPRGKGYDVTEVDEFLDRAAAEAGKVESELTKAIEQARRAEAAEAAAADVEAEIERRVAERLAATPPPSSPSEDETAEEVRRTLVLAQRTADAAIKEAREDAEKMVTAAREESETLVADAQARAAALIADAEAEAARERREARQRLAAEIGELEGVRESLRSDVNVLERHVEEQRTQLGSTLAELQQILDDPSGFRMAPAPALNDPALPDFSDLAEPEREAEPEAPAPSADAQPEPQAAAEPDQPSPLAAAETAEPVSSVPAPAEPEAAPAPPAPPAPPALAFDDVDHAEPGTVDPVEAGPPTAPIAAVDLTEPSRSGDEDPFLTELRKAMVDEEPLGPRDHDQDPHSGSLFGDDDRRGWRFGRR
jgi:DivIVA domain-containing protein